MTRNALNELEDRLIRRRELEDYLGISRATLYRLIKSDSNFPARVYIRGAKGSIRFRLSDVIAYADQFAGQ